jgi:hypothetical protein
MSDDGDIQFAQTVTAEREQTERRYSMHKSDEIGTLAGALAKAQGELENPSFDSQNPHFKNKYASLAAVRDAVFPALAKQGLSIVQLIGHREGGITCDTVLMHASGQWISETLYMPSSKQDAQGFGSAITYARRYSLMAICGVVGDEDDDGERAVKAKITPAAGAHEALTKEQIVKVDKVASNMIDMFNAGVDVSEPYRCMEDAKLENEEKIYLWTWLDSKMRSALKKHHDSLKVKT